MHRSQFGTITELESPDFGGSSNRENRIKKSGWNSPVIPEEPILTASHERVIGLYGM
jgi:hypothetical protein